MGIKNLNRYLINNVKNAIQITPLTALYGKKIAVDISIYLYRFLGENALIENMYLMLSIFKHYNIIPIFIFDGKPPIDKKDIIDKRKADKMQNKAKMEELQLQNIGTEETKEIKELKKKCIFIQKDEIEITKSIIDSFGYSYYVANGEADEVCAVLVAQKKVWACLSEDMDMFVYGCNYVLRYLSLLNKSVIVYDHKKILEILDITQKDFREICILSGTDYNNQHESIHKIFKLHKKYKKENNNIHFYEWIKTDLSDDEQIISDNFEKLLKSCEKFDLSNNTYAIDKITISNKFINKNNLKNILKLDGFIF
jgi:flap endonuclease-1